MGAFSDDLHDMNVDVDVDDLLSDESDNDDLIDNEADLALLLQTHGVTLDTPAVIAASSKAVVPQSTSLSQAATVTTTATYTATANGEGSGSSSASTTVQGTDLDLANAESWMAAMEKRYEEELRQNKFSSPVVAQSSSFVYVQGHVSTSQFRPVSTPATSSSQSISISTPPTSNVPTRAQSAHPDTDQEGDSDVEMQDSTQEHLSGEEGEDTAPVESAPADTAATEEASPPFIMDPEDNRRLTSIIRSQTANALEVNRKYQQALQQKLRDIEQAHNRNKQMRADLQVWLDRCDIAERAPVVLPSTNDRLGPPYFVDDDDMTPPDNMDTIQKKKRPLIVTQKMKAWSKVDRANLKRGVIAENKRLLFEKFLKEGNNRAIESLINAPEVEMMLNTKGLDWKRISQRYVDKRTPSECLIQWTGRDHPGINKGDWSKAELLKLDALVTKYKGRNWIQIALDLDTNRTGAQCFKKYHSKMVAICSKDNWTQEEDNILTEAVRVLGEKNWQQVSYCLENRNAVQCMTRWTKSLNPAIRRGRWLKEEDGALRAAFEVYGGGRWAKIQQHVLGRTDIQCRERYMNILTPNLQSGPWTKEEVERLDRLVEEHGEKWSLIASLMNGRTDNQCARRWKMTAYEVKRNRKGKAPRRYLASRRRKGRTTMAVIPTVKEDREAIQKAMRVQKRWERKIHRREKKILKAKERHDARQNRRIWPYYSTFLARERLVYDCWNEQWGDHVDPVEKVLNLGIPPPAPSNVGTVNQDQFQAVWDSAVPDQASLAKPGKVRPVPPSNATLTAFSNVVQQGYFSDGRFQLTHSITTGKAQSMPGEFLTAEEQAAPEYKELEERFEAVFAWPMLAARVVQNGLQAGTPAAPWQEQSETDGDIVSSEYETDEDEHSVHGLAGGSPKRLRTDF
ncbi:Myblike DNAbinding domain-containing protein [Mortierella sp. GBA35]|nr:Myblike DNAbinding domain-containing protein [Mortierella sp. GBA35]